MYNTTVTIGTKAGNITLRYIRSKAYAYVRFSKIRNRINWQNVR